MYNIYTYSCLIQGFGMFFEEVHMEEYYLYTFESTHGAISSHKLLKEHMDAVIMPVLREITASCGMSVRVAPEDFSLSLKLMRESSDTEFNLYHVTGKQPLQLDPGTALQNM